MWKHDTKPITFCLCVDDFGVKYTNREDVEHLLAALNLTHKVTTDWKGKIFFGLTFDWNYTKGYVDVSMPGYIPNVLHKFQRSTSKLPHRSPYNIQPHKPFIKGHRQYALEPDTSPPLDPPASLVSNR